MLNKFIRPAINDYLAKVTAFLGYFKKDIMDMNNLLDYILVSLSRDFHRSHPYIHDVTDLQCMHIHNTGVNKRSSKYAQAAIPFCVLTEPLGLTKIVKDCAERESTFLQGQQVMVLGLHVACEDARHTLVCAIHAVARFTSQ